MSNSQEIYLDHAATTPIDPEVLEAMLPFFADEYGNASSRHTKGQEARKAIDHAKDTIAGILNCSPSELIFTGSGTEANNLAILGTKNQHIVTTTIEHSSILKPCQLLPNTTYLDPTKDGLITEESLKAAIKPETSLISIIQTNNEIGTIQDIPKLAEHKGSALFHTDACQSFTAMPIDVQDLNVDLLTLNGSKIYGPKGVGLLYIKQGTSLSPIIHGGDQQAGRSGTLDTASIVGLAKAMALVEKHREKETERVSKLRDNLLEELLSKIAGSALNGSHENRHPNNLNIWLPKIDANNWILLLDQAGIYCSSGSACNGSSNPSHVLLAIGCSPEQTASSLRLTLGKSTIKEDIEYTVGKIVEFYQAL